MDETKEKLLYFMDELVLSAFKEDEVDINEYVQELNNVAPLVDDKFKQAYENKKQSVKLVDDEPLEATAYAQMCQNDFNHAVATLAKLYKNDNNNIEYLKHLSNCLLHLNKHDIVVKNYIDILKQCEKNNSEITQLIANAYFGVPEKFDKAIPYFEKLILNNPNKYSLFYQLSFLYERVYQNKKLDKQIEYAQKAYNLAPDNNLVMAFLAKLYYRNGDKDKAVEYFEKMMENNPTPEEQVLYSRLFMKEGELAKGYDIYRVRFKTSNVAYPKDLTDEKRWDGKTDLSDATVIVHYEQGFGDSVMFVRYLPRLAKLAKKVILVIQKNLIPILKSSGFDKYCEILSHEADINPNIKLDTLTSSVMYTTASGMSKIPHDYHIPMMDLPYLFKESPQNMLEADGYLKVDETKLKEYKSQNIVENGNLKIGISYHGTSQSNQTYRDIHLSQFIPLFKMKGVDFYSFQADEYAAQLDELPDDVQVYDLGRKFRNFEDTACAMKCMDVVVSTDNVVMNLAGALGLKTFGLFNVFTESRWYKTNGKDIGWYKSVKPFQAKNFNDWQPVIEKIKKEIEKLKLIKSD